MKTIRIAGLSKNDFTNGQGVTVTLFLQGCPHHCKGCHSPQTWDPEGGMEWSWEDLLNEILTALTANGITRNLSLSGGDPLAAYNLEFTKWLCSQVKEHFPAIDIYVWTGYAGEQALQLLKDNNILGINYLITDPFILEERDITLPLRGSRNQRVWKNIANKWIKFDNK